MPNAGDEVKLVLNTVSSLLTYEGIFAGYDTVTENYIIEDCYWAHDTECKRKMFFNRRYVVMITRNND
jgi:hypothetical protein